MLVEHVTRRFSTIECVRVHSIRGISRTLGSLGSSSDSQEGAGKAIDVFSYERKVSAPLALHGLDVN
jgi:hypothetical protein